jgi:hypothetical protein
MSRSCVCGGSNENCRFCGGLGTISDRLATALISHVGRPESEFMSHGAEKPRRKRMGRRTSADLIPCSEGCGALLNRRNVGRHLQRIHGVGPAVPERVENLPQAPSAPTITETKYQLCPKCGVNVRTDRIGKHLTKAHKSAVVRPSIERAHSSVQVVLGGLAKKMQEAKTSVSGLTRALISKVYRSPSPAAQQIGSSVQSRSESKNSVYSYEVCSVCKAKVRVTRIEEHMARVHMRRVGRSHAAVVRSSKDPLRQSTSVVAPLDKNLDATKLYAHPCREHGRYGSHPSHDGFDDESTPD